MKGREVLSVEQAWPLELRCRVTEGKLRQHIRAIESVRVRIDNLELPQNPLLRSFVQCIVTELREQLKHKRANGIRSILWYHLHDICPDTPEQLRQLPSLLIAL
jgi:hypothetical protein